MKQINTINKKLLKQTLFTVAYYNALGYYPTSFFVWKNLIETKGNGVKSSFGDIVNAIVDLIGRGKISEYNGMYKISYRLSANSSQTKKPLKLSHKFKNFISFEEETPIWYKEQIQKNKISTDKIKRAKQWASMSRWVPYLRGLFLTGTLAMKRGGNNSDWDVLVVIKKDRIWIGRLIVATWFHLICKRRNNQKIKNRFCLNQFVVDKKLKFKEENEFFGNELLMTEDLMGSIKLKNIMMQRNKKWIKMFKPNFKFKRRKVVTRKCFFVIIQRKLENILESFKLAEMLNTISKKIMIRKIIDNPKTYSPGADIRYSDFFLVFLPRPQRVKIRETVVEMLTKMNT
jgi:hypothetical protein